MHVGLLAQDSYRLHHRPPLVRGLPRGWPVHPFAGSPARHPIGGTHDQANLRSLCKPRHSRQSALDGDRWRQTPRVYTY